MKDFIHFMHNVQSGFNNWVYVFIIDNDYFIVIKFHLSHRFNYFTFRCQLSPKPHSLFQYIITIRSIIKACN